MTSPDRGLKTWITPVSYTHLSPGIATRRHFLAAGAALGASLGTARAFGQPLPELLPSSRGRRVLIVGGGWAGLTAARRLRQLAPELDVCLLYTSRCV